MRYEKKKALQTFSEAEILAVLHRDLPLLLRFTTSAQAPVTALCQQGYAATALQQGVPH